MPVAKQMTCILAAIVASAAGMVTGITQDLPRFSAFAAGLFGLALVAVSVEANLPYWQDGEEASDPQSAAAAAVLNARLVAMGYLWGAVALFMAYRLTPLRWQHGLQYGAGMALIAWFIQLYVHFLIRPGSRLRSQRLLSQACWASALHGAGAVGGLAFLLLSGKIASVKDDWAANLVFLSGGIAIVALSVVSVVTHLRLTRSDRVLAASTVRAQNS